MGLSYGSANVAEIHCPAINSQQIWSPRQAEDKLRSPKFPTLRHIGCSLFLKWDVNCRVSRLVSLCFFGKIVFWPLRDNLGFSLMNLHCWFESCDYRYLPCIAVLAKGQITLFCDLTGQNRRNTSACYKGDILKSRNVSGLYYKSLKKSCGWQV